MTYEERQKAICKECTDYNTSKCPYVIRSLRCPNLLNQMEGWELGYKDAIDKARQWLLEQMFELNASEEIYVADADASSIKEFMDNFKKAMEEQQ